MSKFTWNKWDYDCDGEAYIIRKDLCPNREDVPKWIIETDKLHHDCINPDVNPHLSADDVKSGWCKFQVRTDWNDGDGYGDGSPRGWYCVYDERDKAHIDLYGKKKRGWFEVWIVRVGEWY
jgi:hypothetical protein